VLRQQYAKEVKNGTKNVHLTFHRELVQCLEEVTPRTEACGKNNTLFLYHLY